MIFLAELAFKSDRLLDSGTVRLEMVTRNRPREIGVLELQEENGFYSVITAFTRELDHYELRGKEVWRYTGSTPNKISQEGSSVISASKQRTGPLDPLSAENTADTARTTRPKPDSNINDSQEKSSTFDGSACSPIIVQGRVRRRCTERITVPRPYELFADVFLSRLSAAGIQTGGYGGLRPAPLPADTLGGVARALQPILNRALKNSDNLSAESLFFQAAYEYVNAGRPSGERIPCTAADGAEAVRALFSEIGMDASAYGISDGCGLSPYDRTSADAVVVFLRYAASRPELFYPIYNALSVAGTDGTLRRRMKGTPAEGNVRGKTGSVTGVSSLAGYLTAPDGHLLAFAILNQNARRSSEARKFQDAVCTLLCSRAVRP